MEYTFITKDEDLKKYLFNLKEECIIKHEDNWFKENHIPNFILILMKQNQK